MPSKRQGPGDSGEAGALTRARVGRPMMQDAPVEKTDEGALRRERTRLAQRKYRSRRETASNTLKTKVEKVELALEKTIKSFTKFQNFALESSGLPPDVTLALSRTALEITNHLNEARAVKISEREQGDSAESSDCTKCTSGERNRSQEKNDQIDGQTEQYAAIQASAGSSQASSDQQGLDVSLVSERSHTPTYWQTGGSISPQPTTVLFPWAYSHQNLTFAQRLRLACIERGFQLLSKPNISFTEIHPALSLHLKWMTVHELRTLTEQTLYSLPQLNAHRPIPPELVHPDMYRTVEGSESVLVNREPSRDVERLIFGRTRTVIETALPGFEGEWLEPVDVQEYLEDKGIFIGIAEVMTELPLAIPETSLRSLGIDIADSPPSAGTQNTSSMFLPWITNHALPNGGDESFPGTGSSQVVTTGYPAMANPPAMQEGQAPGSWMYANGVPSQLPVASETSLTYFNPALNLQQLIEYLALSAICIGPGPGMRKADVDKALKHSIAGF